MNSGQTLIVLFVLQDILLALLVSGIREFLGSIATAMKNGDEELRKSYDKGVSIADAMDRKRERDKNK